MSATVLRVKCPAAYKIEFRSVLKIFSFSFKGRCPEDHVDVKGVTCQPDETSCDDEASLRGLKRCRAKKGQCPKGKTIFKAHGPLTGFCVPSDR